MSTEVNNSIDVKLDATEVVTQKSSEDIVTPSSHNITLEASEGTIVGTKKEYSIVGDAYYTSLTTDDVPVWLSNLIDNLVDGVVSGKLYNYDNLIDDVRAAINAIDIAKNAYTSLVNFEELVDGYIGSKLETLNASIGEVNSQIIDLDIVKSTVNEALALRIEEIEAAYNDQINSRITSIQQTLSNKDLSLASSITGLTTRFKDVDTNLEGKADAISGLQTYVGLDETNNPVVGTGLLSRVQLLENQNDGVVEYITGTYDVMIGVTAGDSDPSNDELDVTAEPYATWIATDTANGNEAERSAHIGDVFIQYDGTTGNYVKSYKFIKTAPDSTVPFSTDSEGYTWALVTDTDAQSAYLIALEAKDLADGKRRVFVTQPYGPYDRGDLWVDTSVSPQVVKVCILSEQNPSRSIGFLASEWDIADKVAQDFIANTYNPDSAQIHRQLDGKIEYFFYESATDITDPITNLGATSEQRALDIIDDSWSTSELKDFNNGNIVYFKDTKLAYWYQASTPAWVAVTDTSIYQALQDAAAAKGAADGKVSQFYAWGGIDAPANYELVVLPAVYKTDEQGNYVDANGNITTDPNQYVILQAEQKETFLGEDFIYWHKSDNILYHKPETVWEKVPTTVDSVVYIAEGDILSVLDPNKNDLTTYVYKNGQWAQVGPTGIISKSKFFVDLANDVTGPYGHVSKALTNLQITSEAYANEQANGAKSAFLYGSDLEVNGTHYKTGFGLVSLVEQEVGVDGSTSELALDSEFYVNAERFAIIDPQNPTTKAVFKLQNGTVQLGVENTEATRNEPKGAYLPAVTYYKGDIVTYNGSSYTALVQTTDTPSTTSPAWQLLSARGDTPLLFDWTGNDSWPVNTTEASALSYQFGSRFFGQVIVRILAYDAESGVRVSLNSGTPISLQRTLGNDTQEWYELGFTNLIAGNNDLRIWSTTADGGSIKAIEVAFVGATGLTGAYIDYIFTRDANPVPPNLSNPSTWYTDVSNVPSGTAPLWSLKKTVYPGGATTEYSDLRQIEAPLVTEVVLFSKAVSLTESAPAVPTNEFTYDFVNGNLLGTSTNWSLSFPSDLTNGKQVYRTTALFVGNNTVTDADPATSWSVPVVYAAQKDGVSPPAPTITNNNDGTYTIDNQNGDVVTIAAGKQISVQGTQLDNNTPPCYIKISSLDDISVTGRGHRLVIFDPVTYTVSLNQTFDTYGSTADVASLVGYLNNAENGNIAILSSYDATRMTSALRLALLQYGSLTQPHDYTIWGPSRVAHVFIGFKGAPANSAYEAYSQGSEPAAYVSATFTEAGVLPKGYTPLKGVDYFDGNDGTFKSFVYKVSSTKPSTPTGGSFDGTDEVMPYDPADSTDKWTDDPQAQAGDTEWVSSTIYKATKTYAADGTVTTTWTNSGWSTPALFYQEGLPGQPADTYKEIFLYQNAISTPTTLPSNAQGFTSSTGLAANYPSTNPSWTTTIPELNVREKTYRINLTLKQPESSGNWVAVDSAWQGPIQVTGLDGDNPFTKTDLLHYQKPFVAGTGSTNFWNGVNDGNDRRELDTTPFDEQDIIWKAINNGTDNDGDGGFDSSYISIDSNKTYRFSVFIKQTSNNGSKYFGTHGRGGSVNNLLNMSGTSNDNPYFWIGTPTNSVRLPENNKWYLITGFVYPYNIGTTAPVNGGVYDVETGERLFDTTSFKWHVDNTTGHIRMYQYYNTTSSPDEVWFWNPRIDEATGEAPSVNDLLRKGKKGVDGTPGSHGAGFFSGGSYQTLTTDNAGITTLFEAAVGRSPVIGDVFTQVDANDEENTLTKRYEGNGVWGTPALLIDGSMVVKKGITADNISVNSLQVLSPNAGTITAGKLQNLGGTFVIDLTNGTITISV